MMIINKNQKQLLLRHYIVILYYTPGGRIRVVREQKEHKQNIIQHYIINK